MNHTVDSYSSSLVIFASLTLARTSHPVALLLYSKTIHYTASRPKHGKQLIINNKKKTQTIVIYYVTQA